MAHSDDIYEITLSLNSSPLFEVEKGRLAVLFKLKGGGKNPMALLDGGVVRSEPGNYT